MGIKAILNIFKPGPNNNDDSGWGGRKKDKDSAKLTNQKMVDELCKHFEYVIHEESFEDVVVFPTYFKVLLTKNDYASRKSMFKLVVPKLIQKYYKIIKKYKEKYPESLIKVKYWLFQFSPCEVDEIENNGASLLVRPGHVTSIAEIEAPSDVENMNTPVINFTSGRCSVRLDQSVVDFSKSNIDVAAIQGLEVLSEGEFKYKYDETMEDDLDAIDSNRMSSERVAIAELRMSTSGGNYTFDIYDSLVHVSGQNDTRRGSSYIKLPVESLPDSCLQIKHVGNMRFQIAAFTTAVLNQKPMKESQGGSVQWENLPNKSSILLDNSIGLSFHVEKNKE